MDIKGNIPLNNIWEDQAFSLCRQFNCIKVIYPENIQHLGFYQMSRYEVCNTKIAQPFAIHADLHHLLQSSIDSPFRPVHTADEWPYSHWKVQTVSFGTSHQWFNLPRRSFYDLLGTSVCDIPVPHVLISCYLQYGFYRK